MAYATVQDVQAGMLKPMTEAERTVCETLLERAAVLIDAIASGAKDEAKKAVSCSMVQRALASGSVTGVPIGATQGSMSALGYQQSWTLSSGAVGELYLSKNEKLMLGISNSIGSYSPVQELVGRTLPW